jgi:hypothetical protein
MFRRRFVDDSAMNTVAHAAAESACELLLTFLTRLRNGLNIAGP